MHKVSSNVGLIEGDRTGKLTQRVHLISTASAYGQALAVEVVNYANGYASLLISLRLPDSGGPTWPDDA